MRKKLFLYVIPLLLVLFVLPGLVKKSFTINTRVDVRRELKDVYVGLADPAKLAYWFDGFSKIEHVQGMPFVTGSVYRITWERQGKTYSALEKVVEIDWRKHLKLEMKINGITMVSDYYFYLIEDRTVVDGVHHLSAQKAGKKILLPWAKPMIRKELNRNFENFRKMMEAR